MERKNY
jgi:hypothetical protein